MAKRARGGHGACGAGDGRPCCSRVIPILEAQSPQLASFPDSSWNFDFSVCFFPHRVFFNLGARVLFLSYFFVRDFEEPKTAGELEAGGILLWECSGGWDPQDPPTLPVGDTLWGLNGPVCGDSCKNKHQPSNPHFPPKFLKVLPSLAVSVSGEG